MGKSLSSPHQAHALTSHNQAIDFADMHPQSQVFGIDLSPVQPGFVPPNLSFQIDDIEEPWTYGQKFDFIYSRMMVGSLANVPRFFEQSFENLAPGGVLEMADIAYPAKLNGGDIPEDSQLYKWCLDLSFHSYHFP